MTNTPDASDAQGYEGYVLPAENAAEMARLMLQDHMLTQAMGGPLPEQADLSQISQVLDIGCGSGGWLFDVVQQYPHIHAVGIDISQLMIQYANSLVGSQQFPNAQFRVMDATQPLDFPDNTFDLVNARILTGFLSTRQWPALLAECYRITKPGGILRLTEAEWGFTESAAYERLVGLCYIANVKAGHSFSPSGRTYGTTNALRPLMQRAGYEVMGHQAHAVDYSAGTEDHDSNCQNLLVFHKLFQPFLVQMHVATQQELDQLYAQTEKDMHAEDFSAIDYFLTVWGRKAK